MSEPTTGAVMCAAAASVGIAGCMPLIDGNALFGSIIGAALIAMHQSEIKPWQRIIGLLISACVGYVSASEIVTQTPITQTGPGGFVGACLVVPIALKALELIQKTDFSGFLPAWFKRGGGQ
ncbi:putative holin [Pseudomonas sp. M30-35]|uniref:putative holin n=1 Tax=Pseudomonas sp. M30-35 TaxID=1981174 RepID=UPI0012FE71AF|nr:putative holin [Pseudomonas sp. M30-35]